jgi:PhoPQ-activated pathogenicity-related protein
MILSISMFQVAGMSHMGHCTWLTSIQSPLDFDISLPKVIFMELIT